MESFDRAYPMDPMDGGDGGNTFELRIGVPNL